MPVRSRFGISLAADLEVLRDISELPSDIIADPAKYLVGKQIADNFVLERTIVTHLSGTGTLK